MRPQGAHDCHRRSSAGKQRVWAHPHAHTQLASTCESLHGLHQSIRASGVVHAITQRTALLTSARHCAGVGDCQDSVSTHLRWSVCWQRVWPKLWHQKCFFTRNHFARLVLHQWLVRELALKLYFKLLPHCFCVVMFMSLSIILENAATPQVHCWRREDLSRGKLHREPGLRTVMDTVGDQPKHRAVRSAVYTESDV